MAQDILCEREAATYIGISASWLRKQRMNDRPGQPPYIRITHKAIRYKRADLDTWLVSRRHVPAETA